MSCTYIIEILKYLSDVIFGGDHVWEASKLLAKWAVGMGEPAILVQIFSPSHLLTTFSGMGWVDATKLVTPLSPHYSLTISWMYDRDSFNSRGIWPTDGQMWWILEHSCKMLTQFVVHRLVEVNQFLNMPSCSKELVDLKVDSHAWHSLTTKSHQFWVSE